MEARGCVNGVLLQVLPMLGGMQLDDFMRELRHGAGLYRVVLSMLDLCRVIRGDDADCRTEPRARVVGWHVGTVAGSRGKSGVSARMAG